MFVVALGYIGVLEVRLGKVQQTADRAWDCGVGHTLSGCVRRLGAPSREFMSSRDKAKVSQWSSGRSGTSYTISVVSRDDIIVEILNLDVDSSSRWPTATLP